MAEVKGNMTVRDGLSVDDNATFQKGVKLPYLELQDVKSPGTPGGVFNPNTWKTRDLNTTVFNSIATTINLAASDGDGADFIIPAGTYHIEASAPAAETDAHVARLADVTDASGEFGSTVILGTAEYSPNTDDWLDSIAGNIAATSAQTRSKIEGRFEVTRPTTLEIQHRAAAQSQADTTRGFGIAGNFYLTDNVYTVVKMWTIKDNS